MEEPAFVSHGEKLSPRARVVLAAAAVRCERDYCVVILEGGRSSELIAASLGLSLPAAGSEALVTVGSVSQAIDYLREDGQAEMGDALKDTFERCPDWAMVMLHAWGDCWGVILYTRHQPERGVA